MRRVRKRLNEFGARSVELDRMVVLRRGTVNIANRKQILAGERGVLIEWFFALINFLEREAPRRGQIPFERYVPIATPRGIRLWGTMSRAPPSGARMPTELDCWRLDFERSSEESSAHGFARSVRLPGAALVETRNSILRHVIEHDHR